MRILRRVTALGATGAGEYVDHDASQSAVSRNTPVKHILTLRLWLSAEWAKSLMTEGLAGYENLATMAGKFSYGDHVTLADVCK